MQNNVTVPTKYVYAFQRDRWGTKYMPMLLSGKAAVVQIYILVTAPRNASL